MKETQKPSITVSSGIENQAYMESNQFNQWGLPKRVDIRIFTNSIEIIYKETSLISYGGGFDSKMPERVYKIIYSCIDGKWNESERIYGEIVGAMDEYYKFQL